MEQTIFDILYPPFKINKKIRTIELFGGYGSQLLSLKYIGADVEQWKLCEWAVKSIQAYKDLHFTDDNTDYSKELTIEETKQYLFNKGISNNYNEPMALEQIKRLNENQARTIYNNIKARCNNPENRAYKMYGGRGIKLSKEIQALGLRAGINGMLSGDYLTTDGVELSQDKELIRDYQKV